MGSALCRASGARSTSIRSTFVERHFLGAAVAKLRRAGAGMVRHLRGGRELVHSGGRAAKSFLPCSIMRAVSNG